MTNQTISPCLWFDNQAEEAAEFYVDTFDKAALLHTTPYLVDTPSNKPIGSVMTVDFEIAGYRFTALNGGSFFTPNPSISFFVHGQTEDEINKLWSRLSDGGEALMPLQSYPFSTKYGWVQDRYGISWQLMLAEGDVPHKIMPSLMFTGEQAGRAEEAIHYYTSVFNNTDIRQVARYGAGQEPDKKGTVMYADFTLEGQPFAAMDSAQQHQFGFSEGISLVVNCGTQNEIDYYWAELSAQPDAEQCGWLKDLYGVSWQIVPRTLEDMLRSSDEEKARRVITTLMEMKKINIMEMKKININELQHAADHKTHNNIKQEAPMERIHYSTKINAPKQRVWNTMLQDETYRQWTGAFTKGSHYKGSWDEGSKILFLDPNGQGMVSRIARNKPYEFISIEHLGFVEDGKEDTESAGAKAMAGAREDYTLTEKEGVTEVRVDMDTSEQYKAMFQDMWPKALQRLKELSERQPESKTP